MHQRAVIVAASSDTLPAGFNVILLLYFKYGAATLAKGSSFLHMHGVRQEQLCEYRPAGGRLLRQIQAGRESYSHMT